MTDQTHDISDHDSIPGTSKLKFWFSCYPILFGLAYSQAVLFTSNQNTKFITGLSLAGYGDIASDWMAKTTDPFPIFSYLLKWQYQILGLHAGVHLAFLLVLALYAISAVWLAKHLVGRTVYLTQVFFHFSMIWMIVHFWYVRDDLLKIFPSGLGEQYMLGGYYQPCVFGVLLLTGTAAYLSKRISLAALCFVIAALLHPTYLFSVGFIAVSIVLVPANQVLKIGWRNRLLFLSAIGLILGTYALWMIARLSSDDPLVQLQAHALLAEFRIPHHANFSEWDPMLTAAFVLAGLAAAWLERKRVIGQLLFVLFFVVATTMVWATISSNPTISVVAPWRVSTYMAPLSWIVLLTAFAGFIQRLMGKQRLLSFNHFAIIAVAMGVFASATGIANVLKKYRIKQNRQYYAVSRFLENYHQPGFQYMVPVDQSEISLEAGVPVFVTWKTHPTKDSEFLEWYERYQKALAVYELKLNSNELENLINTDSLTHIVWPPTGEKFPFSIMGQLEYADEHFSVWDMR